MSKKSSNDLHDAGTAVADFLDILLQEATEPALEKPVVAEPARVLLMPDIELAPATEQREQQTTAESAPVVEAVEVAPPQPAQQQAKAEDKTAEAREAYQFPLQCLMFTVGDNLLSIPLIDLGGVLPWHDRLTQLPDMPDWFLGLMQHRDSNVKVANTAYILRINTSKTETEGRHLLVFGDDDWALSCDKLGDVLNLEQDQVQWSAANSSNLALGTIRESLATLLDPKKILKRLNEGV